jgi:hypothetical protein
MELKYNPDANYPIGPKYHTKNINLDYIEIFASLNKSF